MSRPPGSVTTGSPAPGAAPAAAGRNRSPEAGETSGEHAVVRVRDLVKVYNSYSRPLDRLKQALFPQRRFHHQTRALDGISFDVLRGETFGIVGRNGSGKSTLLQVIAGTLAQTTGSVEIDGRISALLELGAGFHGDFTGRENVFLYGAILGFRKEAMIERLPRILDFAEIGEAIDQPVRTYSSGMYVRLAFAVAVHVDPDILIVDEALAVGDAAFQRKCFARLEAMREAGATILFVSHAEGMVLELCDRALLLHGGEPLALGTPKEIIGLYHRVLYTSDWRTALSGLPAVSADGRAGSADGGDGDGTVELPEPADGGPRDDFEAYYDPSIQSKSRTEYDSDGAVISNIRIETPDGRRVNVLRRRDRYVYAFDVSHEREARRVRYGMLIKTRTGVELTSVGLPGIHDSIPLIPAGGKVTVRLRFCCLFTPGIYFCNAGSSAVLEGERRFLHRFLDALMFRVAPERGMIVGHTIDLLYEPEVTARLPDGSVQVWGPAAGAAGPAGGGPAGGGDAG